MLQRHYAVRRLPACAWVSDSAVEGGRAAAPIRGAAASGPRLGARLGVGRWVFYAAGLCSAPPLMLNTVRYDGSQVLEAKAAGDEPPAVEDSVEQARLFRRRFFFVRFFPPKRAAAGGGSGVAGKLLIRFC